MNDYQGDSGYIYSMIGHKIKATFNSYSNPILQNRGLHTLFKTKDFNFYCIFKKQKFMTFKHTKDFNQFFFDYPEYKDCLGESINKSILDMVSL